MLIPGEKRFSEWRDKLESASDVEGLVRLVIEEMVVRFNADVAMFLVAPGSSDAICWASTAATLPEFLIPGLPAKIVESELTGRALKSGQIQAAQEPGLMTREQTVLVVPLKSGDAILGLLRLGSSRLNALDPALLSTIETAANIIAQALVRLQSPAAIAFSPTVQGEARLPTGATDPLFSPAMRHIYERVYRGVARLMICDRFLIALDNPGKGWQCVYQVVNGMELPPASLASEQEMLTYVSRQRSGIIVTDREREARFGFSRAENLPETKSAVCVPLVADRTILGVVLVSSSRAKSYTESELGILTVLADLMVMVVQTQRK